MCLSVYFSVIRRSEVVDLLSLFTSVLCLFLPMYFSAYYGVTYWISVPIFLLSISISTVKARRTLMSDLKQLDFRFSCFHLGGFFFIFIILAFVFASPFNFKQELYVNPDPYGYSSVTGAVKAYGDFQMVLDQYQSQVGVPFRFDANWDNPSEFVKLASPWHIPNVTLKYGIANGYYLHNGFSFLIQRLNNFSAGNDVEFFVVFWSLLTILSCSFVIGLAALLGERILQLGISNMKFSNQKFELAPYRLKSKLTLPAQVLLIFFMALNSRWFAVFVIEGFGNQILSYAICLASLLVSFDWLFRKLSTNTFTILAVIFLCAQFFVYAQQLVFQALIFLISIFAKVLYSQSVAQAFRSLRNFKKSLPILFFAIISPIILKVPIVDTAIRALQQNGGGGATHLGVLSPLKTIGLYSGNFGKISDVRDFNNQNLFLQKIWPESGPNGISYQIRGQGYDLETHSLSNIYFSLAAILIFLLLICFTLYRGNRLLSSFILLNLIPLVTLEFYYFYSHTGSFLIENPENLFNDYIWMRILAYSAVVIWPIFSATILQTIIKLAYARTLNLRKASQLRTQEERHKLYRAFILFLTSLNILIVSINFSQAKEISQYSDSAIVIDNCGPVFTDGKTVYLSTESIVPELMVSVCGSDVRFINDSFPVLHEPNGSTQVLYRLERTEGKGWRLFPYANFVFNRPIQTPCDLACFESLFSDSLERRFEEKGSK